MPVLSWSAADLRERGPVVPAVVSPVQPAREAMRAAGRQVPPAAAVTGLIDTGSARSAIDRGTAARLGLRPVGSTLVSTLTSAGGVPVLLYAVQLVLAGQGSNMAFDMVTVVEASLADQQLGVLIGRDVLASAVFVYTGPARQCTISF